MIATAVDGTAEGLLIPGLEVGGKTGTAQLGTDPPRSHAWIIGFAGPPGQPAEVAVAVIVEGQDGASEQTGGQVAAPIARAVMEAVLQQRGQR
jgi:peptidoglycan glycosyltransferase